MSWRDFFRRPEFLRYDFFDIVPSQHPSDAEPDIIFLRHRRKTYELRFAPHAIDDGLLTIGQLRHCAAEVTGILDVEHIKLLYKGTLLDDDTASCQAVGLKRESEVMCVVSATQPVVDLTEACRSAFNRCLTYCELQKGQWAENRLADFILWADGVGALAAPRASLDSRFQSKSSELILVKGTLQMLLDFLDQCIQCAESGDPVREATGNVDSALENLALLAMAVRRNGRRSRLEKAGRKFEPDDHRELQLLLKIICLYRLDATTLNDEALAKLRKMSAEERALELRSNGLSSSQERLLQTNLRRRNRFVQAQRHSEGLKSQRWGQIVHHPRSVDRSGDLEEREAKDKQDYRTDRRPGPQPAFSSLIQPTLSGTSASIPESKLNVQTAKRSSAQMEMTTVTTLTAAARYPKPPKLQEEARMFKCPCCCQTLPVDIAIHESQWKKHLAEDLSPYTCLLEDCPVPFSTYATEHDWENHVKESHPPRRLCPFCQDTSTIFLSMEAFLEHVQGEHAETVSESLMMAVMSHSGVVTIGVENCPLCASSGPESDPGFIRHVLQCMHDFSLRTLPWAGHPPPASKRIGTYNLETPEFQRISHWLTSLNCAETIVLQLSKYDDPEVFRESIVDTHFEHNAYFDLESAQDSVEALERSSRSFSQQEAELENVEETDVLPLPFPVPSYLRGSQYMNRLEAAYRGMPYVSIGEVQNNDLLPPPSRWNVGDMEPGFQLINEGLGLQYSGPSNEDDNTVAAIYADYPMPCQCRIYYFEIRILSSTKGGVVTIGFSNTRLSLERPPQWEADSWEYHSDDGRSFSSESGGEGRQYGPTFGKNDIVGCGVDFELGRGFFTKNGLFLGHAFRDLSVRDMDLYPALGARRLPLHIEANFGEQEFMFDIDGHVKRVLTHHDYRIGWICTLPIELSVATHMLDSEHPSLPLRRSQSANDCVYTLGNIGEHNLVIVCPQSHTTPSSIIAELAVNFPSIQCCIKTGIGAGVPSRVHDIRLGDVVVGTPGVKHGGVIHYDFHKGSLNANHPVLNCPPRLLMTALAKLRNVHLIHGMQFPKFLPTDEASEAAAAFRRPSLDDLLYESEYLHDEGSHTCLNCDTSKLVPRHPRNDDRPWIHYGAIASTNLVLKDARVRDRLSKNEDIVCVSIDADRYGEVCPCLTILGIADYADSHKNKSWQAYAAAVSAAYAKELLLQVPSMHKE